MKNTLAIALVAFLLNSCSTSPAENYNLAPVEFQKSLASTSGALLLDVRTPEELQSGYLKGALNFDFKSPQFKILIEGLDKERPCFVYCASGIRSGKAAELMREAGFRKVYTMEGGLNAWKADGLATDLPASH